METNVFKFIWKYFSKLKFFLFTALALNVCGEVLWRGSAYCSAQIIDLITVGGDRDVILSRSVFYIGVIVVLLVLNRLSYDIQSFLETRFMPVYLSRVSKDLFNYVHRHSTSFFAEEMSGSIASKIRTVIDDAYQLYYLMRWNFLHPAFSMLIIFSFIFRINAVLAFAMLGLNLLYAVVVCRVSKMVAPYSEIRAEKMSAAQGALVDSISNVAAVKSFGNFPFEKKHYYKYVKEAAIADRVEGRKYVVLFFVQGAMRILVQAVCFALPVWYWYEGKITVGDFVLVQTFVFSMGDLYMSIIFGFLNFFKMYGGIKNGLDLLSRTHEVVDAPNAADLKIRKADVAFQNVFYHYKGSIPLFNDFNLKIEAGEKIGLVGHSGSGKSTLVKLLSRYYDIQDGKICIGGQDISLVTQDSLRRNIALIPQDPSLFNRTIMENIRYGNLKATDKEVMEAAEKAHIHDFIMALPQGYDSKVGERGVMLSGGERQRIAIARAVLKNAPILILDEATSALDSASEKSIQESMRGLMKGKTVIAIAHRLSTLKEMDRLVVMEKGCIVETGTHAALLRKKGFYQKFYEMQSAGFLAPV